jgi:hypothetical protein
LSIGIFLDLLPGSIDPLIYKVDSENDWTNKVKPVNIEWMIMFWKCLRLQYGDKMMLLASFNVVSILLLVTSNGALAESSILKHLSLTQ